MKNYIIRQHIPCDLEIISETSIQVHPVKLFLFMTKDVEVYEQTKITARQGKRLDIESAYIDAGQVIEDDKPCEKRYIHVFQKQVSRNHEARYSGDQKYKEDYLVFVVSEKIGRKPEFLGNIIESCCKISETKIVFCATIDVKRTFIQEDKKL